VLKNADVPTPAFSDLSVSQQWEQRGANKAPSLTPPPDMPWLLEELARSSEEAGHSGIGGVMLSPLEFSLPLFLRARG